MIELQRALLADPVRNKAFYNALAATIKKDKSIVADIGSGTGFLSFIASELGAKTCHLYEYSDMLFLSKKIAAANKIKNLHFVHGHSTEEKNPPQADIVISETLGNFALEENIVETMNDAHRFLKPGGVIMPAQLTQFVAPITSPRIMQEINIWDAIGYDLDFSEAKKTALNNMYVQKITPRDILPDDGAVQTWDTVDFYKKNSSIRPSTVRWETNKPATIYGFGVWWSCLLAPNITLSTSPFDPPTHWDQIFLPLESELRAVADDVLEVTIACDSRYEVGINVAWEARLQRNGKIYKTVSMNMQKGLA